MGAATIQLEEQHGRWLEEFLSYRWDAFVEFLDEQTDGAGKDLADEIGHALVP